MERVACAYIKRQYDHFRCLLLSVLFLYCCGLPLFTFAQSSSGSVVHSYATAVASASPSVVNIYTVKPKQPAAISSNNSAARLGSGVIVSAKGYILTNNHVIRDAIKIYVVLKDGRRAHAQLIGTDPDTDIAVLKISLDKLSPIKQGDFNKVHVGDVVLAIGNPFGLGQTVTQGIISALGRSRVGISQLESYIQTDAAINPGNSGGALINTKGQLVGINTGIYSRTGGYQGVGFAVPVSLATNVLEQIIAHGSVSRGWLGVKVALVSRGPGAKLGQSQVMVTDVFKQSPAQKSGLHARDVITKVNNFSVLTTRDFQAYIASSKPGDTVNVSILRGTKPKVVSISVGVRPDDAYRNDRVLILPSKGRYGERTH